VPFTAGSRLLLALAVACAACRSQPAGAPAAHLAPTSAPTAEPAPEPTATPTPRIAEPSPTAAPTATPEPTYVVPVAQTEEPPLLSPLEELRERARVLEPEMQSLAQRADELDGLFRTYIRSCYDRYSGRRWPAWKPRSPGHRHEWLDTSMSEYAWDERWVWRLEYTARQDMMVENCRGYWSDFVLLREPVDQGLDAIDDRARREGILPGHKDELLEHYGLLR
jgi:hypothetical protein